MEALRQRMEGIVDDLLADYGHGRDIDAMDRTRPDQEVLVELIQKLRRILFPGFFQDQHYHIYNARHNLSMLMEDGMYHLSRQLELVYRGEGLTPEMARDKAVEVSVAFFQSIPRVRARIQTDLQAAFDGDPAAYSKEEIVFSYPGFFAINVYRLAHELYRLGVPMLPRMMSEHAHSLTGIDIHPGATIGDYFFIDHGTGIVIGQTTVIGDNVKIYQGVTLGGLSTRGGQSLKGTKRHPTIEDNVTIYANAAILGGNTVIGRDCVIGASAFITASVPPRTTVSMKDQELHFRHRGYREDKH